MLVYAAATGIGMAVSAIVKNLQVAASFGPLVIVISATFAGPSCLC